MREVQNVRSRYVILAVLFAIAMAFQLSVSVPDLKTIWQQAHHFEWSTLSSWALVLNLHFATPFACLLLGFYVAAVRVWDRKAWLLLAVLVSFSVTSDGSNRRDEAMAWHTPLKHFVLVYRSAVTQAWPICMVLFAIYFPVRARFDRERSWLKWIVLLPALAIYVWVTYARVATNEGMAMGVVQPMETFTDVVRRIMVYVLVILFLIILSAKLATAEGPDDRRRLRVLFSGLALSVVPALVYEMVIRQMMAMHPPEWVTVPTFTLVILFPVTLAYVTVVQRALDVRMILREGLQYAAARRGLVLMQILSSTVVVVLVAILSGRVTFPGRIGFTAAGIAFIFGSNAAMQYMGTRLDRRFFREAYNAEQILAQLSESVGSLIELKPLLTTVATRVSEALHISEIAVFLCEQNSYRVAFALGYPEPPQTTFGDRSQTVAELQETKRPVTVYLDDPRSWVSGTGAEERGELTALKAQLLVPLRRRAELLGFLSLGTRQSEAPYSTSDIDLLESVGQQTALAVENSRLTSTIAAETAEREILQRELSIAREVQQRLLPQSYPTTPELACFGTCRPAREVGGDYFDFLELPEKALGFAIGDVAGKGIPASLLVASLQASLRGQTLGGCDDLPKLMSNVNQLVYAASPVNRYATFFYAQYEPALRRLTYVNAGHNPPLVIAGGDGRAVMRLEAGGPPVGLLPQAEYQGSSIDLAGGDLLVLFTDGMSEAMNSREEEWGEESLIAAVKDSGRRDPTNIVESVFRSADAFAGEAPQHDDMTIVVVAVAKE